MSDHPHKFRYLLPPGNNFAFVAKFKIWLVISVLLMAASISILFVNKAVRGEYMNWTTDFKGGTDIIFAFKDKHGDYTTIDPGKVREAFAKAGEDGIELSDISITESTDKGDVTVSGLIIKSPRFSALIPQSETAGYDDFMAKFKDRGVTKATWSGDRLFVRAKKPITNAEAAPVFAAAKYCAERPDETAKGPAPAKGTCESGGGFHREIVSAGLELKPWSVKEASGAESETDRYGHPDEGTGEYNEVFAMWGLDKQYEGLLEKAFPDTTAQVEQSYGVGAKAGDKLRDDAAKSIVFALFLIMLYLAFRFDVRYAPGAAFATVHDAVMVIGVFALTWTEVSLTSVAAMLTVMGYSTNDTVIVFDRIRENQAKLKDKKIERIIDISLNEMLTRTILTSSTVFATTLVMNIFGTGLVRNFAFAMNIGVIVGTYSSIFLAAPIFMWISRKWYSGPAKKRVVPASAAAVQTAEE